MIWQKLRDEPDFILWQLKRQGFQKVTLIVAKRNYLEPKWEVIAAGRVLARYDTKEKALNYAAKFRNYGFRGDIY